MVINTIFSYLVQAGKHLEEQPEVSGTQLELTGNLYGMIRKMFDRAPAECNIEILFNHNAQGLQQNDCRDLIVDHLDNPTLDSGRAIATRLQTVTTLRSGMGLVFIISGNEGNLKRLVIARFPAEAGVLAEFGGDGLQVEFIDRVFMKNTLAYKSVVFQGEHLRAHFWDGFAVDRQINSARELSDYWIHDFLLSDLKTTSAQGSKRLGKAFRLAVQEVSSGSGKEEIISALRLLRRRDGQTLSGRQVTEMFHLSDEVTAALNKAMGKDGLFTETFRLDLSEVDKEVPLQSVELDNGAIITGLASNFDNIYEIRILDEQENRLRIETEGVMTNQSLRKSSK